MGLIGSVGGYAVYEPIRGAVGGRRGVLIAAMAAAWFSVLLAAGAFTVELAASGGGRRFLDVLTWMALVHAAIGVGEALVTGLVVRFVLQTRPEIVEGPASDDVDSPGSGGEVRDRSTGLGLPRWLSTAAAGLAVALAVAVFLAPFASEFPDGLEYVGGKLNFLPEGEAPPLLAAPMPGYQALPGPDYAKAATALAGSVGTLTVFAVAWALAKVFPRRRP